MVEGGVVVMWDATKRFGFIRSDDSQILRDVYFHETRVSEGLDRLKKGARVSFELVSKPDGRYAANNVKAEDNRGAKLWAQN
jgi:cold shock CspA family protein